MDENHDHIISGMIISGTKFILFVCMPSVKSESYLFWHEIHTVVCCVHQHQDYVLTSSLKTFNHSKVSEERKQAVDIKGEWQSR